MRTHADVALPAYEATVVADQLVEGLGTAGWRGDPRLELRIGILAANTGGLDPKLGRWVDKGEEVARRYEVWRHCEDGVDRRLGSWLPDQLHEIIPDLVKMDPSSPAHVSTEDRIDAHNRRKEAELAMQMQDTLGEMMEHGNKLFHDLTQPRNVFRGIPGLNPDKQD
jgi:hypothetical protein